MTVLRRSALAVATVMSALSSMRAASAAHTAIIPSIECKAFLGFEDSWAAGSVEAMKVHLRPGTAAKLSYYHGAGGNAAFAPRGWRCQVWAGVGSVMIVVPPGIHVPNESKSRTTAGPAVTAVVASGDTSGRFLLVKYASWYFPRIAKDYIHGIVKSDKNDPHPPPVGPNPYPHDNVTYLTPMLVRIVTPPRTRGFGTDELLAADDTEIVSFVKLVLSPDPGMVIIRIRLPASMRSIEKVIARVNSRSLLR